MQEVLRATLELIDRGQRGVMITVTSAEGSTPQAVGARMLLRDDDSWVGTVGGGAIEKRLMAHARQLMDRGEGSAEHLRLELGEDLGMTCGGAMSALLEPVGAQERLIIFGAGHVARPTAQLAAMLGYAVVVVDWRDQWATHERFPDAAVVAVADYLEWLEQNPLRPSDHVLLVTHGHERDTEILAAIGEQPLTYLGMIGSRNKARTALAELAATGVAEAFLRRVHVPVGLAIGGHSPEEIAISIMAELIAHRHGVAIDSWDRADIQQRALQRASRDTAHNHDAS